MARHRFRLTAQQVMREDVEARKYRCAHCGLSTGGLIYKAANAGRGIVTGGTYRKGQQLHPSDCGICMCKNGIRFVG